MKSGTTMEKLREWLKGIGLEQYWKVFSDNDIDFDALPDFSEPDFDISAAQADFASPACLKRRGSVATKRSHSQNLSTTLIASVTRF